MSVDPFFWTNEGNYIHDEEKEEVCVVLFDQEKTLRFVFAINARFLTLVLKWWFAIFGA